MARQQIVNTMKGMSDSTGMHEENPVPPYGHLRLISYSGGQQRRFGSTRLVPLDQKCIGSLAESTPRTWLVQGQILLPQPATRPWFSPWEGAPQSGQAPAPCRTLPTLQARKPSLELAHVARTRRILSGRPVGSVRSRDRAPQRPHRAFTLMRAAAAS